MNHPERQDNQESGQWNNYKNAQSQRKIRKENTSVCETMLIYLHGPSTKDDLDASFLIHLYYNSWKNWNSFSLRLGPPYSSWRSHLSGPEVWRKGVVTHFLIERKCFYRNANTFYTKHFCLPIFVPTYYFPCVILQASLFPFIIPTIILPYSSPSLHETHKFPSMGVWFLSKNFSALMMFPKAFQLIWPSSP